MNNAPILVAEDARIAIAEAIAIQSLSLQTRGARVIVIDESEALFELISGLSTRHDRQGAAGTARLRFGSMQLMGHDIATGAHYPISGYVPAIATMPGNWRVDQYLRSAAKLSGCRPRHATAVAEAALARLDLKGHGRRWIKSLNPLESYVVALAAAIVHEPSVLVIHHRALSVPEPSSDVLADALGRALDGRASLTFGSTLASLPATILTSATDVCVLREGSVLVHTAPQNLPAGARLYDLSVTENAPSLCEALEQEGFSISGGPMHFSLTMPASKSVTEVLRAALKCDATVLSCQAVW